ncbi:hypothetical protein ACTSEZ_21205 [Metabacillus sp. JX24]|uniref:hypothetical protein n=1 Tax=Metabacillus sp. JX24 TaxID=3240759 RepID=UPI00350F845C
MNRNDRKKMIRKSYEEAVKANGKALKRLSENGDNSTFEKLKKEMKTFEEGFPDGVYAIPRDSKEPRLNVRAMYDYCKEKGVKPKDITDEEMMKFIIYPTEVQGFDNLHDYIENFEKGFPDSVYVAPGGSKEPRIKVKALFKYCEEKGVDPQDLTEKERREFLEFPGQDEK